MKDYKRFMAVLIGVLIVCLPIYTADVFAANLDIIGNEGTDNYEGFLDSNGDTWSVKAEITGVSSVSSNNVELELPQIGSMQFDTCYSTTNGHECVLNYAFQSYPTVTRSFNVKLFDSTIGFNVLASDTASVSWEANDPVVTGLEVTQSGTDLQINFSVGDKPFPTDCNAFLGPCDCSGIKQIDIYDNQSLLGTVLGSELTNDCGMNFVSKEYGLVKTGSDVVPGVVRVKAFDNLNRDTEVTDPYLWDGTLPNIDEDSLEIRDSSTGDLLGDWVDGSAYDIEISINISENGPGLACEATSDFWTGLQDANDVFVDWNTQIHTCVWYVNNLILSGNYDLDIMVRDGASNIDTESFTKTFSRDDLPPLAAVFGTTSKVSGVYYVSSKPGVANNFFAEFDEDESGMDAETVRADLSLIYGGTYDNIAADNCTGDGTGLWTCYWSWGKVNSFTGQQTISLTAADDKMGNPAGGLPLTVSVEIDDLPPSITDVKVRPAYEDRRFVQQGDEVEITFTVTDDHNFDWAEIDLSQLITGYGTEEADSCDLVGNKTWDCTYTSYDYVTADSPVDIEIFAYDEVGNMQSLTHNVEVLKPVGVTIPPSFWTIDVLKTSPASGIDMQAVESFRQMIYFTLELTPSITTKEILETKLMTCTGDASANLNRYFMINKWQGSENPILILEFNPFTPNENKTEEFNCTFNLFTRDTVTNEVITTAEVESLIIEVPFYETVYDSASDRLETKLEDTKKSIRSDFWNTISVLSDIVQLAKMACAILPTYEFLKQFWELLNGNSEALRNNPYTYSTALSICYTAKEAGDEPESGLYLTLIKFCKIISCRAGIFSSLGFKIGDDLDAASDFMVDKVEYVQLGGFMGTEGFWGNFNAEQAAKEAKISTSDPYSNIFMAIAHLCLPAIIYNIEKLRQIECRYYGCLKNDVGSGVATIDMCDSLRSYMRCKYFVGAVFSLIPYASFLDSIINKIKSFITDPVGILMLVGQWAFRYACKGACVGSNSLSSWCTLFAWTYATIDIAQDWAALYYQWQGFANDYCRQMGLSPLTFTIGGSQI